MMENSFEDYLKPEIEMWIDNYREELEDYPDDVSYTAAMLDKIDLDEVATKIADNEYITEFLNNCIRDEIDNFLREMESE